MLDQLIIPCSGRGSRFHAITDTPKFLIEIAGRTMLDWSIESMRMPSPFKRGVVIIHEDQRISHEQHEQIVSSVRRVANKVTVITQQEERRGAADSLLRARDSFSMMDSVAVWNCDQWCPTWNRNLLDADGWVLCFRINNKDPKWSYARLEEGGGGVCTNRILEIAEKRPISKLATVGAYFFKTARDLFWAAEESICQNERINGEFYVAPIYNHLIKLGRQIVEVPVPGMEGLGTPDDVDAFCKNHSLPDWKPVKT